jgi:hypothetical protein
MESSDADNQVDMLLCINSGSAAERIEGGGGCWSKRSVSHYVQKLFQILTGKQSNCLFSFMLPENVMTVF